MKQFSRRLFLLRSSLAAASVAAAPVLMDSMGPASSDAPAAGEAASGVDAATASGVDAATGELSQPLVAHVKDLSTGEISLFSGTREIVTHDPQLAGRLFRAAK